MIQGANVMPWGDIFGTLYDPCMVSCIGSKRRSGIDYNTCVDRCHKAKLQPLPGNGSEPKQAGITQWLPLIVLGGAAVFFIGQMGRGRRR